MRQSNVQTRANAPAARVDQSIVPKPDTRHSSITKAKHRGRVTALHAQRPHRRYIERHANYRFGHRRWKWHATPYAIGTVAMFWVTDRVNYSKWVSAVEMICTLLALFRNSLITSERAKGIEFVSIKQSLHN